MVPDGSVNLHSRFAHGFRWFRDGSGMVPGWFRAFRLELVNNDKVILRAPPKASDGPGMVPGWLRACYPVMAPRASPKASHWDCLRTSGYTRLLGAPGRLCHGSVRFAQRV